MSGVRCQEKHTENLKPQSLWFLVVIGDAQSVGGAGQVFIKGLSRSGLPQPLSPAPEVPGTSLLAEKSLELEPEHRQP